MEIKLEDEDYIRFLIGQNVYDDQIMDPTYKVFLEHLREDGKSYVLEMNGDNGIPVIVNYEGEDDVSEKNMSETHTSSGGVSFGGRDNSVAKREQSRNSCSESGEGAGLSSKKQSELPLMDESYQMFLHHLKLTETSMILELNSVSITYEEEGKTSIPSEVFSYENNAKSDEQDPVPYKMTDPSEITVYEDGNSSSMVSLDSDCYELTDFKTKLTTVLSKPYDKDEYEKLMNTATERKPLSKQKHLRSMSISYETKEVGLSYLDHFPDLAEQIWASDCDRRLNLLRGFFFWLKHVSHEGAYMPWVSSGYEVIATDDCEEVVPLDMAEEVVPLDIAID